MTFSFSIEYSGSIVHITVRGTMDRPEALRIIESFTSHPSYAPTDGILFDVRETDYLPGYSEVSAFYHEYRERYKEKVRGKMAFIVGSKIQYGIARMSSTLLSSVLPNMEVFLTEEDGLQWLRS